MSYVFLTDRTREEEYIYIWNGVGFKNLGGKQKERIVLNKML